MDIKMFLLFFPAEKNSLISHNAMPTVKRPIKEVRIVHSFDLEVCYLLNLTQLTDKNLRYENSQHSYRNRYKIKKLI